MFPPDSFHAPFCILILKPLDKKSVIFAVPSAILKSGYKAFPNSL
jgi:hypothetical protein